MKNTRLLVLLGIAFVALGAVAVFVLTSEKAPQTGGMILQPTAKELGSLPVGPENKRVDLKMPVFSNPTNITNPLFPVKMSQVILSGHIDGEPQQVTYSLLPETRRIMWNGKEIETVVIQYNAYLDRRIIESATDWYAQDDEGNVWYFGEDVFNYQDGEIADTHGTWLVERDGPAALIMPAHPKVGDIFRVENIPGIAFEEITVKAVDTTIDGAFGPISGVMIAEQLHMDSTYSDKAFAPGIGEYVTATPSDLEVVALALPADAIQAPVPNELKTLTAGFLAIYEAAGSEDWGKAQATLFEIKSIWNNYKLRVRVSNLLGPQMDRALVKLTGDALAPAVSHKDKTGARLSATDAMLASLDLELQYRTRDEVDGERLAAYARKAIVDSEASEPGFLLTDVIALEMIEQRLAQALGSKDAEVKSLIKELRGAATDNNFKKAIEAAGKLVELNAP